MTYNVLDQELISYSYLSMVVVLLVVGATSSKILLRLRLFNPIGLKFGRVLYVQDAGYNMQESAAIW